MRRLTLCQRYPEGFCRHDEGGKTQGAECHRLEARTKRVRALDDEFCAASNMSDGHEKNNNAKFNRSKQLIFVGLIQRESNLNAHVFIPCPRVRRSRAHSSPSPDSWCTSMRRLHRECPCMSEERCATSRKSRTESTMSSVFP